MSTSDPAPKPSVVLAVDDHPLIRHALREVVGLTAGRIELIEASDPEEGLALLRRRADVDLVFLDLHFPRHDGAAFLRSFRAAAPAVPLIVYTMEEDLPTLRHALACGAAGIVPKSHSAKLVEKAIDLVLSGGVYIPAELARQLALPERAANGASPGIAFGEQQSRILELLARGLPNKAIARELGIAPNTVKNQLTVVFEKLGVTNRTQAAIVARALVEERKRSGA